MNHEVLQALKEIALALSSTRAEVSGLRVVLITAVATIQADEKMCRRFADTLRIAREAEHSYCLSSAMSDEEMQQRLDWIDRLTPHAMLEVVA